LTSSKSTRHTLPDRRHGELSRWLRCLLAASVSLMYLLALPVSAQTPVIAQPPVIDSPNSIRLPTDFNRVEFYLITVDVGNNVWDNFGHTALRVVDESTDTDLMFNWGLFDPSVGYVRFAANFARGIMDYQLGVSPPAWELGRYQAEQRTVWQDRLILSNPQKMRLYQRLAWNVRPENIVYEYDYFFDNCTTRVRDYLNEALGGGLLAQSGALSSRTFRDEVRAHYASVPLIDFSLDILMNKRIDQQMTQWQRMFLPLQLREQLLQANLLTDSRVLMEFDTPPPGFSLYYLAGILILPVLLMMLGLRRASIASFSSQPGLTLRWPALSYRVLGLIALLIATFSGIYGLIMVFGWLYSSHADLHGNINLMLFWPTDIVGTAFAIRWLLTGRAVSVSKGQHTMLQLYLWLHLLAVFIYLIIGLFGLADQRIGSVMLFVVPLLVVLTLLVSLAGLRKVRSFRFN
jgi:hypothetical protein